MLEKGTKIMIKNTPDNEYLNQGKYKKGKGDFMVGEITSVYETASLPYSVKWDDESTNTYSDKHIEPVNSLKAVVNNYEIY